MNFWFWIIDWLRVHICHDIAQKPIYVYAFSKCSKMEQTWDDSLNLQVSELYIYDLPYIYAISTLNKHEMMVENEQLSDYTC